MNSNDKSKRAFLAIIGVILSVVFIVIGCTVGAEIDGIDIGGDSFDEKISGSLYAN